MKTCYYTQKFQILGIGLSKFSHLNKQWLILAMAWLGLMIYALLIKPSSPPVSIAHWDKFGHFGLFFGQIWLLGRSLLGNVVHSSAQAQHKQGLTTQAIGLLLVVALILAISTEVAQGYLTATRTMDFWDGVADMVGATVAVLLLDWASQKGYLKHKF